VADAWTRQGVLADCLGALIDDVKGEEFVNAIDRDAALEALADVLVKFRQSVTKR
jgi:hypothetical protein